MSDLDDYGSGGCMYAFLLLVMVLLIIFVTYSCNTEADIKPIDAYEQGDYENIRSHIINDGVDTKIMLEAYDVDKDGSITSADYLHIKDSLEVTK